MKAIILAAGMGTRLRPLTEHKPKGLVEVHGTPIVERQLQYLHEKGIEDITVVTGYLQEKYAYLQEKYGVKLVHNDKYDIYNNIYTMYLVRDILPGSYVVESDFFWVNNVLDLTINESACFCNYREKFEDEWVIRKDENDRITAFDIDNGTNDYILSGLSYWTEEDGKFIVEKLEKVIESGDFTELYWDEMVKRHLGEMNVKLRRRTSFDSFEIDSVEDLEFAEEQIKMLEQGRKQLA